MSELGAKIDLLTYGEGEDVDLANVRIRRIPRFAFLGNVKTGPSMLKLFLDVFIFVRTVGLLVANRYDVVHAHEEAVFFCRFLKPLFRFRLIYDMHSSLPQQLKNFNYTDSKLVSSIFRYLEDTAINAADAVITICPDLADYVDSVINDPDRHYLIENSIFEPVKLKSARNGIVGTADKVGDIPDLTGKDCFVYAGTLEHYQGIDLLIDSFAIACTELDRAFLLVVGGTPEQVERYRMKSVEAGVSGCCHFTGRLSQLNANRLTALARVLVSPRIEGTNTPLKVYQQLASGIPVVATGIYSHTQVLTPDVAFLADPNADSFAQAMITAMSDPDAAALKVQAALRLYRDQYSRDSYVRKLSRLLENLG